VPRMASSTIPKVKEVVDVRRLREFQLNDFAFKSVETYVFAQVHTHRPRNSWKQRQDDVQSRTADVRAMGRGATGFIIMRITLRRWCFGAVV
jgi:hypothetical protein